MANISISHRAGWTIPTLVSVLRVLREKSDVMTLSHDDDSDCRIDI
jgi:hypothetical protein